MYENILIAIAPDHGDIADVLDLSVAISAKGAKLTALTVVDDIPNYVAAHLPQGQMEKITSEILSSLEANLKNTPAIAPKVAVGHSATTILDVANEMGVDCIVLNSHRPNMQDYFLGSTAGRVVRRAVCAVHVVR